MSEYKLEVLESPGERLRHRRIIQAADDDEAIRRADEFFDGIAADPHVALDRYVLYQGERIVRERIGTKR